MAQGLGGAPFLRRHVFKCGFKQQQRLAVIIDEPRYDRLGRDRLAVRKERPSLAHRLALGGLLHKPLDTGLHGRRLGREIAVGQGR